MADFSHLRRLPLSCFVNGVEYDDALSDDFFDHLLDRIEPPLFEARRMQVLRAELCWFAPRAHRGRPRRGSSRAELANAVISAARPDIPRVLLDAIHRRLVQQPAHDRLTIPRKTILERQKKNANSLMNGIYANLLGVARGDAEAVHPLIAEKAIQLTGSRKPREDALKLTQDIMRDNLRLNPPSLGRMRNMIRKVPRIS